MLRAGLGYRRVLRAIYTQSSVIQPDRHRAAGRKRNATAEGRR
jgi:hypothetical protein